MIELHPICNAKYVTSHHFMIQAIWKLFNIQYLTYMQLCIFKHKYISPGKIISKRLQTKYITKLTKFICVCMCIVTKLHNCGKWKSYVHGLRSTTQSQYKHQQNLLTVIANK